MSGFPQCEGFALTVGDSGLGKLPRGWESALASPAGNPVLKDDSKTLIWRLELPTGERSVVKLYRQRGGWSRMRGRVLPCRVQREFNALGALAAGGVPCSLPLLWGWGSAPEHGRFELIVTREIAGAVNLKERFVAGERTLHPDELLPLFGVVRRMHECGVYHGALSPKNLLVRALPDKGHSFHVIDLARAVCFPGDITSTRMARFDLLSLLRRFVQLRGDSGCERFLLKYGMPEGELGSFMARLKRFRPTRHTRNWLALRFRLEAAIAQSCRARLAR